MLGKFLGIGGLVKGVGLINTFFGNFTFCNRVVFVWEVRVSLGVFEFCFLGFGVVFLLELGLDLRLLFGFVRFVVLVLDCFSEFIIIEFNLWVCGVVKLEGLFMVRFEGVCSMVFKVVGFKFCWLKFLFKFGLGGKGILICGGKSFVMEVLSFFGDRLIFEGFVLGGRLLGVWG